MKTKLAVLFLVLLVATTTLQAKTREKKGEVSTTFTVNLHCESCVKKIQNNLSYEKGVRDLKVSLENKEVMVTYIDGKNNPEALIKAFEKLGYSASVKQPEKGEEVKTPIKEHVH